MAVELAQFFTPAAVVEFAFDALSSLGMAEAPRRVVDPACGDGAFLRAAAERFPEAGLWGCDLDEGLGEGWRRTGLTGPRRHLAVQDGLVDAPLFGLGAGTFDLVVGNPPYGLSVSGRGSGERIESRFVRRFVALARRGGWLAIVVPEGIVANAQSQRLRDWVFERAAVHAVVALPEATFAATGTRARTALVVAHKGSGGTASTLLASPCADVGLEDYLAEVMAEMRDRG